MQIISTEFAEEHLREDNMKYLGMHGKYEANDFIGMRWIEWSENDQTQEGGI